MLLDLLPQLLFLLCFTPVALLWGGCCCQPSCTFFTDNFTRADSDDPGDYTEVSGDWDISSNALVTSSSNGVLVADTSNPDDALTKVQCVVSAATDGDIARIILNYQDSNNYWFAEAKIGTGAYLRIYQRSGGSNTQKATVSLTLSTSTVHTFCASIISAGRIVASIGDKAINVSGSFSLAAWGLGTGTLTGTVVFDSLSAARVNDNCGYCALPCVCCDSDDAPTEAALVFSGITSGPGCGATCTSLNGTYFVGLGYTNSSSICVQINANVFTHCNPNSMTVILSGSSVPCSVTVNQRGFNDGGGHTDVLWGDTYPETACRGGSVTVPLISQTSLVFNTCTFTGSTCQVTFL